ncbi:hypothetical protein NFI96_003525, partial [Prochilodus magdalenae]
FLGKTVTKDLIWDCNISSSIKKAQQRIYALRPLRKFNLSQELMVQFYTATIESVITVSSVAQLSHQTDTHRLQHIIGSAEKTTGVKLPTLLDLHTSRTKKCAEKIITDKSHPGHHLFQCLPSGRRFSQMRIKTTRLQRSFFPHAFTLRKQLNTTTHIRKWTQSSIYWIKKCAFISLRLLNCRSVTRQSLSSLRASYRAMEHGSTLSFTTTALNPLNNGMEAPQAGPGSEE